MNLRSIFLYNILPKKRIFIAFIGFLISSTIITGGGILMTSIVDSMTSYLGESDDVLVISSPEASTPYTSILPLELADTIQKIPGVLDVSPEVMTAAVYKDKAVYFRGVDVNKFWDFTDVTYVEGLPLTDNDTFDVSVGINYARRNNLDIGDYMTVISTRSDAAVELRVKSIFVTGTLLDDEIIAPIWIGQFFSFDTFNYITHIRVRIDLDITSKEAIYDLVTSYFSFDTVITTPGLITELNATLYVRSAKGNPINELYIINDNKINNTLPYGEYEMQVDVEGILSDPVKFILNDNSTRYIYVNYIKREVQFQVITDEDEPIEDVHVTIYSKEDQDSVLANRVFRAYTDENGQVVFNVANGSYVAEFRYEVYWKSMNFVTQETNNIEVELISRHPSIYVESPFNHSTIVGEYLNVSVSASTGYSIYYYVDGVTWDLKEYYYRDTSIRAPKSMLIPFEEGDHSITFVIFNKDYFIDYDKSKNYGESTIYFSITNSFPDELGFVNVMNGSQIYPDTKLYFNNTLFFDQGVFYKWDNEDWRGLYDNAVKSPEEIGIHKLTIKADTTKDSQSKIYYFIVTSIPESIGVIGLSEHRTLKENDLIQTWFNPESPNTMYYWDSNPSEAIPENGKITVQGLSQENHTLTVGVFTGLIWRFASYNIIIDNSAPNVTLSVTNGSTIDSGSDFTFSTNETLSFCKYSWDGLSYSFAYEGKIQAPIADGTHNLSILYSDLAGNTISKDYTFTVINFGGGSNFEMFLKHEYSGLINQSYIDLEVYSSTSLFLLNFELSGPFSSPIERSSTSFQIGRFYLYPGTYSLTITYYRTLFENRTRTWNFQIFNGLNESDISSNHINSSYNDMMLVSIPYFDVSFTISSSSTMYLTDGVYTLVYMMVTHPGIIYTKCLEIDTILPGIKVISPSRGESTMDVFLQLESNAVETFFTIEYVPEVFRYENNLILLENNYVGVHSISFFLIDQFYNENSIVYSYNNGLEYVPVNLTFQTFSGGIQNISNLEVTIESEYNNTKWTGFTNVDGQLSFNIFQGSYTVLFERAKINYNFTLNTEESQEELIYLGKNKVSFYVEDYYAGIPIQNQYCTIRDLKGNRIATTWSDSNGLLSSTLYAGNYLMYFTRSDKDIVIPFQVYSPNHMITFEIPSVQRLVQFIFHFDNGTNIYNFLVTFESQTGDNITTTTGLSSSISLWLSYGIVNITFTGLDGNVVLLRRSFEPGKETFTIIVDSEIDDQWLKIPFKPIAGFEFVISLSMEYMDRYLQGSLLFTYTLAYTEIILILIVVIINMYSILQNMYKESKRETNIVRMIGGTNVNTIMTVFSRLGLVAIIASFIGYGLGLSILKILAGASQTVFFGHTFTPSGGWTIFLLNTTLIILIAMITTIAVAIKSGKEKRIVYTRR